MYAAIGCACFTIFTTLFLFLFLPWYMPLSFISLLRGTLEAIIFFVLLCFSFWMGT
ncbi:hypothetical protein EI94DRAFT_1740005 [Lactarius quietus]|nr:hypothetical protein EI94DRAFT_1740005 [Lactarius quietus]